MFLRKRAFNIEKTGLQISLLALVFLIFGAVFAQNTVQTSGLQTAERAIRRAAAECYALEGVYPPSYEYLRENYGFSVSGTLYFVDYRYIEANIMPEITVLPREDMQ